MKKSNLKVFFVILIALSLIITSFAGCGRKKSNESDNVDSNKQESSEKTETKDKAESVKLSFLNLNPESKPAIDEMCKTFMEKNPNIIIEHEAMNSRQYDQRIQALAASKDLPDIPTVQMFPQYKEMARNGLFEDLANTELIKSGKFDEVAKTALMVGDNVYGVTWNHLAVGTFYNIDIFDKYNIEIPKDWESFLKVCETLKNNGVNPIVSPLGDGWTSMYPIFTAGIHEIYAKNPDYDADLVSGKEKFNNTGWTAVYEKLKLLYDKGYFGENPMGGKYEQSLSDFANGKGAMLIIGSWVIPVFQEVNPDLKFSMFPSPFNEKGEEVYAMFESELGMAIAENSKYKDEALKFFEYFYTKEPYEKYLMSKKGFSAVKGIDVSFDPSVKYITENYASVGKTFPYMSREWPAGQDALMFKVFQEIMMGTKKIPDGLDEMDKFFTENKK